MSEAEQANSAGGKDRASNEDLTKSGSACSKVKPKASKRGSRGRSHKKKSRAIAPREIGHIEAHTRPTKGSSGSSGSTSSKSVGSTGQAPTREVPEVARTGEAPADMPTAATPRPAPSEDLIALHTEQTKEELSAADYLEKSAAAAMPPAAMPPAMLAAQSPGRPVPTPLAKASPEPAAKTSVEAAVQPKAVTRDTAMVTAVGQLQVDSNVQAATTPAEGAVFSGHTAGLSKTVDHSEASVGPPHSCPLTYDDVFKDGTEGKSLAKSSFLRFDRPDPLVSLSGSSLRTLGLGFRACVLLIAGVTVLLAVFLIVLGMYRTDDADNILCSTEDCREHAALITTGLDYGLDPCRNFSTFVCSAWKQRPSPLPQQVIEVAPSAHADVLARWLMGFKSMLNAGTSRIPVGDRAEAMYDACLSRNGSQVTSLRSFMTELNLSWPDRPSPSVSPLRVLVNMAYNWHTPLWFDVRLVSTRSVRVVVLSPGDYVLPALRRHKRLVASGKYGEYWRAFYESFSTARYRNDEAYPATNASSVQPRPSAEMQGFVLTVLFNATTRGSILRSRFKIEQFDEMTKKDHASEWLSALEESLKPSQSFTSADEVFASGIDVVAATDAIFSRYARADVLELIGWSFADKYGPLADDKLLSERFGEQNSLNARLALCAVEVEKAYQPLVTGLSIVSQFSPETRKAIYEELQSVVDAARNMVADARWMDDNTKALLRLKFENASFNLRTPLVTRIREAFSGAYNAFPSNWSSFLDTWKAVLQLSAQLNRRPGGAPSVLAGSRLPYFDYDYVTNEVLVTAAALSKPFYYTKGTESMFYAGLGFFFVKELVRSIDDTGITVDLMENTGLSNKTDSGNASDPWLSAEAVARSRKRSACLQPTHASTFPEIPALQVAYAAFTRARASLNNRERKLRVAIRFTEDQMFFLTVCHLMCAQHGDEGPLLGDCNKAVSNFPAFADAFSCPKDAPMSASRDCVYF